MHSAPFGLLACLLVAGGLSSVARSSTSVSGLQGKPWRIPEPYVVTIAGSGFSGTQDGANARASFVKPEGVAVAEDGAIYVADAGANNIRLIRDGRVVTFAGEAGGPAFGRGGYVDGPAATARFNRPVAVAVGRGGVVYVADAGNHRIRKIDGGLVTTVAGSGAAVGEGEALASNGAALAASFHELKGVAVDGDGNVYAADFGVGIRKISPSGEVKTLELPSASKELVSIAVSGSGPDVSLAYADIDNVYLQRGAYYQQVSSDSERQPQLQRLRAGTNYGVAIVNANTVVVTDLLTSGVRLVRFPTPPYVDRTMVRGLAGGFREGADVAGGYRDGNTDVALASVPYGIAVAPDGAVIFGDTGNRRIRAIRNLDAREYALPTGEFWDFPRGRYHVVVLGTSYVFQNVLWPESIPGIIEAGLDRDSRRLRLPAQAYVTISRIDAISLGAQRSIIDAYLADGQVDLVALFVHRTQTDVDEETLRSIDLTLGAAGTRLLLVVTPDGPEVSPLERPLLVETDPSYDPSAERRLTIEFEDLVKRSGVRTLTVRQAMELEEARNAREPLYNALDWHFSIYGSAWIGQAVLREIERWRPWASNAGAPRPTTSPAAN